MSAQLVIVCDWIPPEFGAVGQYQLARARQEAAAGRRVTLIGLGRSAGVERESIGRGELTIVRIARSAPDKGSLLARALWAFSANLALLRATAAAARGDPECEILVTGSPPFLAYLVLAWASSLRRRRVTYRITDFYPETALAAGKARWLRPLLPMFHWLRQRADRIEALSQCQRRRLCESGVDLSRVEVLRDASPVAFTNDAVPAPRPFGAEHVVLLYSGNMGLAHDWSTFAEAYHRHVRHGANRVRLWLNATGVGAAPLLSYCKAHALPVHHSLPGPLESLPGVLLAADAHLVLLGEPFWGYVIPSKIHACIDSGRPCLYVGPAESEIHALVSADTRHFSVRAGDVEGLTQALERLCVQDGEAAGTLGALPSIEP